ncbi:hypothetical protein BDW72DRAFT_174788 [Aspergillus terricola var. indicus]
MSLYHGSAGRCIVIPSQSRTLWTLSLPLVFPGCSCLDSGVLRTAGVKRGGSSLGLSCGPDPDALESGIRTGTQGEYALYWRYSHVSRPYWGCSFSKKIPSPDREIAAAGSWPPNSTVTMGPLMPV